MVAKKVVPILLTAGVLFMVMQHAHRGPAGQLEDREKLGPAGHRGEWGKRVPPMFEMWHKRAHEQEQQAQPTTPAPAV